MPPDDRQEVNEARTKDAKRLLQIWKSELEIGQALILEVGVHDYGASTERRLQKPLGEFSARISVALVQKLVVLDLERSARRVCNMIVAEQIDPQEAHAILHALRLIFDSMKLTEEIEAEYRLKEVAARMREMSETNQALYQRLVDLGIAPAIETVSQTVWR